MAADNEGRTREVAMKGGLRHPTKGNHSSNLGEFHSLCTSTTQRDTSTAEPRIFALTARPQTIYA
jgi:hypothetical protein